MIEFILNNEIVKTGSKSGMPLLHFIRNVKGLKGTKAGCKEGDCGACTVLCGTLQEDGRIYYKNIVSCLTPLAKVRGKHIVTIEGLNLQDTKLNAAQQSIKDNHATQCGFCTPGFVVSMTEFALENDDNTKLIDSVSGNICRCTGYKSVQKALDDYKGKIPSSASEQYIDELIKKDFIPAYFSDIPVKLKNLKNSEVQLDINNPVGGGTDIYVKYADDLQKQDVFLYENISGTSIEKRDGKCITGGAVTVSQLMKNNVYNSYFKNWTEIMRLVSSQQIRNTATIAGNFANASPIGDLSVIFLALDSVLNISEYGGKSRTVYLKDFFKDYKVIDLAQNEIINSVVFELPDKLENYYFNFEKVSKRRYLDIASVNTAISMSLDKDKIKDIHISIGGVAPVPLYLHNTVNYLKGKKIDKKSIREAIGIMQDEIKPIPDVRGSAQYKRLLAEKLFYAHFTLID